MLLCHDPALLSTSANGQDPHPLPDRSCSSRPSERSVKHQDEDSSSYQETQIKNGLISKYTSSTQRSDTQHFIRELHRRNPTCTTYFSEADLDHKARQLLSHFLTFERYASYRTSCSNNAEEIPAGRISKKHADVRWPEYLEIAFFKALIVLRPQGGKHFKYPPQFMDRPGGDPGQVVLKGRNELIAELIMRWIGSAPGQPVVQRKHVSSHIQVLRAHVFDDPHTVERWFGKIDAPKRVRARGRKKLKNLHGRNGWVNTSKFSNGKQLPPSPLESPDIRRLQTTHHVHESGPSMDSHYASHRWYYIHDASVTSCSSCPTPSSSTDDIFEDYGWYGDYHSPHEFLADVYHNSTASTGDSQGFSLFDEVDDFDVTGDETFLMNDIKHVDMKLQQRCIVSHEWRLDAVEQRFP